MKFQIAEIQNDVMAMGFRSLFWYSKSEILTLFKCPLYLSLSDPPEARSVSELTERVTCGSCADCRRGGDLKLSQDFIQLQWVD